MLEDDKPARAAELAPPAGETLRSRLRITRRGLQIALGCIWLLDGLLQFQSYMYSHEFISQVIEPTAKGQPGFISDPIVTLAHFYGHDLTLWNTLAAEIQCAIGLGLILSRRAVRPALLVSFAWAFIVWWFGEGFGTILSGAPVVAADGCARRGDRVWADRPARMAEGAQGRARPRRGRALGR